MTRSGRLPAAFPLAALLLLTVPACDGDPDDTDTDSDDGVVAWCDLMDDEDVCVNLLNAMYLDGFEDELCGDAAGTFHDSGQCPRDGAVGACTAGGMEYLYFEGYPADDLAFEESTCISVGGTWVDL
ncbi:MAG: hypothetical protein JRI25_11735 [Deltaproteobacteria bacterium]|nr:hypothetical protein [Deltaproteobacteria bacterium]